MSEACVHGHHQRENLRRHDQAGGVFCHMFFKGVGWKSADA